MIIISDKTRCCGCQACFEACPIHCITLAPDEEGFFYPTVNRTNCINCGLCEKVCPQLNIPGSLSQNDPLVCFAAVSKDTSARLQSSSGGVFSLLAETILTQGGVVFGARFDDTFTVFHTYTETETGLAPFFGSKYVQSDLRGAYSQVREFLKEKRPVLFSGTPCQIAGLRGFLQNKEDENLYLVSVICHGVPSPRVWQDYLAFITKGCSPSQVNMRNKDYGWNSFHIKIQRDGQDIHNKTFGEDPYMKAFLSNLTLRPSCYECQFRGSHGSDLSLGDYWGVEQFHPEMTDDMGTSLILVYSKKGMDLLSTLDLIILNTCYENALKGNYCIEHSVPIPASRARFWASYQRRGVRALHCFTKNRPMIKNLITRLWRRIRKEI